MRILKPVLMSLAAAGLLAIATGSVNAETLTSPWANQPGGGEFSNSGNIVVWYVDVPGATPAEVTIAANWTPGIYTFRAQQECWSGLTINGPTRAVFFNGTGTVNSQTASCGVSGTRRGRVQITD